MGILGRIYNGIQILGNAILAVFEDLINDLLTIIKILGFFGIIVVLSFLVSYFIYDIVTYLSPFQTFSIGAGFVLLALIALR